LIWHADIFHCNLLFLFSLCIFRNLPCFDNAHLHLSCSASSQGIVSEIDSVFSYFGAQEETWERYLEERRWMEEFEYKRDGEDVPRGTRGALDFETPSVS
jgi:hypothetical protein